jgi:hypothetical protein
MNLGTLGCCNCTTGGTGNFGSGLQHCHVCLLCDHHHDRAVSGPDTTVNVILRALSSNFKFEYFMMTIITLVKTIRDSTVNEP